FLVLVADVLIKFGMHRQVAEIVNSLSELIAAVGFIGCNLAHSKICLAQHNALRVNSYENFRYRFNVQIWRQLDDSDLLLWYVHQDANGLFDVKFIYVRIQFCILLDCTYDTIAIYYL